VQQIGWVRGKKEKRLLPGKGTAETGKKPAKGDMILVTHYAKQRGICAFGGGKEKKKKGREKGGKSSCKKKKTARVEKKVGQESA